MVLVRRYRVFLAFAVIATIALIQFVRMREWSPSLPLPAQPVKEQPETGTGTESTGNDPMAPPPDFITGSNPKPASDAEDSKKPSSDSSTTDSDTPSRPAKQKPDTSKQDGGSKYPYSSSEDDYTGGGKGRVEADTSKSGTSGIHWERQPEHFPVAEEDVIKLPKGQAKEIPKIQYNFPPATISQERIRKKRQAAVKESFENSWFGYKETAMGHDELQPVTGGFRDPFSGWGATLVDSLDTLWIMGMKDEFEDAVKQVQKIDFTTSFRKDTPLFETVIRYLGGLIAAYDMTDGTYVILLDKAIELADILMGAFDTPNRMPITYYNWTPASASQPHRAGNRVVVAELASLSLEFTRLAQLTQKNRYYDAIARITDALDEWQMHTNIPGLWPTHVDTSGCKKPEEDVSKVVEHAQGRKSTQSNGNENQNDAKKATHGKRGDTTASRLETRSNGNSDKEDPSQQDCEKQGLNSPPSSTDKFTIGALVDSAYEYLPKEYMLLGGLKQQYRKMYERSMDAVRKYLLFRPMTQDSRSILFAASATSTEPPSTKFDLDLKYEGSHLACFAGGMVGIGAKIFGIKGDLQIAAKLTDSCIWAYESTETGIMPEAFELLPCESMDNCPWDEKVYRKTLDPYEDSRTEEAVSRLTREDEIENALKNKESGSDSDSSESKYSPKGRTNSDKTHTNSKRKTYKSPTGKYLGKPDSLSHDDFVDARIREERLPLGFTEINSRKYILRPEAIESVFIMYRITGDDYWRDRGWEMFQAIEKHTRTPLGNSAINDVTSEAPIYMNQMESFWLGETLKYFYLLFSEPSLVSLDDYVLNTEAHPFKRPE